MVTNRVDNFKVQKSLVKKMIGALQEQQSNHKRHLKTMDTMILIMKKLSKNMDIRTAAAMKAKRKSRNPVSYYYTNTPNSPYY
jgi:hypothetical protein